MPMDEQQLARVLGELRRAREMEWPRLIEIREAYLNRAEGIYIPREATQEYKLIAEQARFNLLPLLVKTPAQNLFVDGYRPTDPSGRASAENSPLWGQVWQPNRLDKRQKQVHRGALKYGYSYTTVLPARLGNDEAAPLVTPWSPLWLTALYEDPINDQWPRYAMTVSDPSALAAHRHSSGAFNASTSAGLEMVSMLGPTTIRVYDAEAVYTIRLEAGMQNLDVRNAQVDVHNLGVCPVVRFLDEADDDGLSLGKIEPQIPTQRQLNQTTFSLGMTMQFQSFRQRWISGMAIETDDEGNTKAPFISGMDKVWQSDSPDTKFGDFSEADLTGYLTARDKVIMFMAVTGQVPPHSLLVGSGVSNISADALVALESAHQRDVGEHQTVLGESWEQTLRLAGRALGDEDAWNDRSGQVVWRDTQPRSLAEVADALGKLATMLEIPPRALWERIPGVTDQDLERWAAMADADRGSMVDEIKRMMSAEAASDPTVATDDDESGEVDEARNGAAPVTA